MCQQTEKNFITKLDPRQHENTLLNTEELKFDLQSNGTITAPWAAWVVV